MILVFTLLVSVLTAPSSYDIRSQPPITKYADYSLKPEGICSSYTWAKQLAQIVSNVVSLSQKNKYQLSGQQLLQCIDPVDDLCYSSSWDNIQLAFKYISQVGLTLSSCYPNKPYNYPGQCKKQCWNQMPFQFNFKANISPLKDQMDVQQTFSNQAVAVFAVIHVDQALNLYSSFSPKLNQKGPTDVFQLRIAEIVGWKDGKTSIRLILRAGMGTNSGYNGYIDLQLKKYRKYIAGYYKVQLKSSKIVEE